MAKHHVTAHSAAFNTISTNNPSDSTERRICMFSMLITALIVATSQQRIFESATHDALARRNANSAWEQVQKRATALVRLEATTPEARALSGFAMVIKTLADKRTTPLGASFLQSLLRDPDDLIVLLYKAETPLADRLMCAAFNAIDRLSTLRAFSAMPPAPQPMLAEAA